MKKILAFLLTVFVASSDVYAFELPAQIERNDDNVTFIVEMEGDPLLAQRKSRRSFSPREITEDILDEQNSVMSSIKKKVSKDAEIGYVYTALFNGFSLDGTADQLDDLEKIDGVKNVYISQKIPVYKPMLESAGEITYTQSAYDSEYDGSGQVIAVIDDSFDTEHEFFEAEPNNPKYSKDTVSTMLGNNNFSSGITNADKVYRSSKIPYAYDYCDKDTDTSNENAYHGTHVAGIAAGKNGKLPDGTVFSGIAYNSQLILLKAGDSEYLYDTAIFAALNDAALLGVDVINMSFGSAYTDSLKISETYSNMFATAEENGISVCASAGNSARGYEIDDESVSILTANPDFSSVGSPAAHSTVTAVASAINKTMIKPYWEMLISEDNKAVNVYSFNTQDFDKLVTEYTEYVDCNYGSESDFTGKALTGKIALIRRGKETFADMAARAKTAGALGVIVINNADNFIATDEQALPMAYVFSEDGNRLLNASNKRIKFSKNNNGAILLDDAGQISYFSSWGVDSTLQLKPEITAPGGYIYSSYPGNKYETLSGTSMSSPHMAGIYAIVRQYYKSNPYLNSYNGFTGEKLVNLIENIAMSSADVIRNSKGIPYSPRVQGAGMVNLKNILAQKVILTGDTGKAKLSLGQPDITEGSFEVKFGVTNITDTDVTFDDISIELVTDGYYESADGNCYVTGDESSNDSVKIECSYSNPESITVKSGETYNFTATVTPSADFLKENKNIFKNGFFIDGFVTLKNKTTSDYASMPFTGFYGDWYNLPIFDTTTYDDGGSTLASKYYPYNTGTFLKAYVSDSNYTYVGRNAVNPQIGGKKYISFSNTGNKILALQFANQRTIQGMSVSVLDKNKNAVFTENLNQLCNKFFGYTFKLGKNDMKKLTEGEYTFKVTATAYGSNTVNDTLELPLVIDNTAPYIVSTEYNESEKTLTAKAKDNHYVSYFLLYENDDEDTVQYYEVGENETNADGTVTKTFDLSAFKNPENLNIGVCDYASNFTERSLESLSDKIGVQPVSLLKYSNSLTLADMILRNNGSENVTADVTLAFYDKDLRFIGSDTLSEQTINSGKEQQLTFKVNANTSGAESIKLFVWNTGTMTPTDTAKVFALQNE